MLIVLFLGACGWQMWSIHKYNAAVREAREAGFTWNCDDTISLIRRDWHNALKKETWGEHERVLVMYIIPDLGRYREMLHHLRPTKLRVWECKDENVDALKGLTALQLLSLDNCTALQNVDGLKGLTALIWLKLIHCDKIPAAALRELRAALPNTDITFPDGSKEPPQ